MAEIADLKPCPFCGGTDSTDNACQEAAVHLLEFKAPTGQRAYRVICACGAQSGADTNYFKATTAWNTRALDAKDKRIAELEAALGNLLRCEYDGHGLTDCVDNDGGHYQSADLAKQIDNVEDLLGLPSSRLLNKEEENG